MKHQRRLQVAQMLVQILKAAADHRGDTITDTVTVRDSRQGGCYSQRRPASGSRLLACTKLEDKILPRATALMAVELRKTGHDRSVKMHLLESERTAFQRRAPRTSALIQPRYDLA
jgi:hypothetical protein